LEPRPDKTRLRIRFTKRDDLRWISHRDLARVWERLLRRANLQLAFSEGFHPKPRISFPSALALGVEALDEIVELEVLGQIDLSQIEEDIRRQMPAGMELISLESPAYALGKAKVAGASYRISVPAEELPGLRARVAEVKAAGQIEISRDQKVVHCETRDPDFRLEVVDQSLEFSIPNRADGALRPAEVLEHLGLGQLLNSGAVLQRIHVHLREPELPKTSVAAADHEPT
jgi:radical SAM-linked protein